MILELFWAPHSLPAIFRKKIRLVSQEFLLQLYDAHRRPYNPTSEGVGERSNERLDEALQSLDKKGSVVVVLYLEQIKHYVTVVVRDRTRLNGRSR